MKETTVPIDRAGRIVLPKSVREELAVKPGDRFKIATNGLSVTLTPSKETSGFIRKGKALVFSSSGDAVLTQETVNRLLEEARDERDSEVSRGLPGRRRAE